MPKETTMERLDELWTEHDECLYKEEFREFLRSEISLAKEETIREKAELIEAERSKKYGSNPAFNEGRDSGLRVAIEIVKHGKVYGVPTSEVFNQEGK